LRTIYDSLAGNESPACTVQALLKEGLSFAFETGKLLLGSLVIDQLPVLIGSDK
jgi:hypothetical protein